jgi:hypothetical protein
VKSDIEMPKIKNSRDATYYLYDKLNVYDLIKLTELLGIGVDDFVDVVNLINTISENASEVDLAIIDRFIRGKEKNE